MGPSRANIRGTPGNRTQEKRADGAGPFVVGVISTNWNGTSDPLGSQRISMPATARQLTASIHGGCVHRNGHAIHARESQHVLHA
jgi:hypothetical protein